ncbi:protein kinase [Corallococcus praedator]|uniref:non-specific serine/threonine protein kinase n=1 Tax=Corallococcus praedator TaxID=2316724 RepID=A0ABX9QQ17_9BACT|nr:MULTISPECIES: serine/threonine-protein kinase [Corallococcus]RKH20765.1 protein kinase [Corallococcus sp. CA047B]RKH33362.1 protein kinase [Corallococcus sp. CA031C]RKI16240.1 protein kinase [Corallococcus praedator]
MSGEPERVTESLRPRTCPQEVTLTDFLAGLLSETDRGSVLAHVESCADCRRVLAAGDGAQVLPDAPTVLVPAPSQPLRPGTRVSRYVVREPLGSGAMGVVFAADDPELGRRVALKMLRPEGRQREELQQRLLREAQALARLSHPNVVTLYDVGTHGDGVFLAMELVEGTTLAEWMKQPRSWKEVLRVFLEAGKGLAAAHAEGLVHRDFKPANTLLGKHGRVFVTDFGIAGPLHPNEGAPLQEHDTAPVASVRHLTRTGQLLGTPAYMAPELMRGQHADARSDAFSFCVALHEALFGVRPFQGETLKQLAQAARQGSISPPKYEVKLPARVRRALLRGLSSSPEERFPSMESLLAELTPRPIRWLARMMATAAVAGILGTLVAYGAANREGSHCEQEVEKLAAAWSPARRERIRTAFLSTGAPYASQAWEQLASVLDAYAAQWRTLRTEACMAAGSDTADGAWQTAACLDARLWQLAAVTEVLEKADVQTVQNAHPLTTSLEGLASCRDAPGLSARPQPPESLRAQVDAARHKLAQARAHRLSHRFTDGLAVTSALIEELKGLDYKPLEAEVFLAHGVFLGGLNKPKEAEAFLYQALWAGEAARDDETVARAWLELIRAVGEEQSRPDEAEKLIRHARAAIERLGRERFPDITTDLHMRLSSLRESHGQLAEAEQEALQGLEFSRRRNGPDSLRMPNFLHQLGRIRYGQGRYEDSLKLHRQALELHERLLGPDNPALVTSYNRVATASLKMGRHAEALSAWRRALALQEASSSPETTPLGRVLLNLAGVSRVDGRLEEARSQVERARAIFERARGPDHITVIFALSEQAVLAREAGQGAEALAFATEALERVQRSLGPDTPRAALPLTVRGQVHLKAGRYPEARRDLMDALTRLEKDDGPEGGKTVPVLLPLAELALATHTPKEALAYCERARKVAETADGEESEDGASALACAGEAHLALGAVAEAVPLLERARRIQTRWGEAKDPKVAGKTAFLLARALLETRAAQDRARALAMAEEARKRLEPVGVRGRQELQTVLAWQRSEGKQ